MEKGDRVILPGKDGEGSYIYPYQEGKFACGGEILDIFIGSYSTSKLAHIAWDNGYIADVYLYRLEYENKELNQEDPNRAFLLRKKGR